jgi:type I site-specific restriction endonuclease
VVQAQTPDAHFNIGRDLTTGFDEPTVDTIILNKQQNLDLYYQMIGRGSRKLPNKDMFTVIDLGNNAFDLVCGANRQTNISSNHQSFT